MVSKITLSLCLLTLAGLALGQSNHWEMGDKGPNDKRLHYEIVQMSSSALQIVTKDITFPAKGATNVSPITYIKAYDQYTNGNGGYVSLLSGGIGLTNTKLHFKSQRGHGFNFILEIWGKP